MGQNDRFANIAASGIHTVGKGLIEPHNRKPFKRVLPLDGDSDVKGIFDSRISRKQQVKIQMKELRRHYAPFMEKYTPRIADKRKKISLTQFQWRVMTPEDKRDFLNALKGGGMWESVTIPHYGAPLGKVETIYRTTFEIKDIPGKRDAVFLHFNGVDYKAKVFFNGCFLGMHEGLFAPFEFECTESILPGENVVVVCVENDFTQLGQNMEKNDRQYTGDKIYAATGPGYDEPQVGWHHCPAGMGIYQDVYLETRSRQFLTDVFVRPVISDSQAEIHMEAYNCDVDALDISFRISIYGRNFKETVVENLEYMPETGRYVGLGDTYTQTKLIEQGLVDAPVRMYMGKGLNFYKIVLPMENIRLWEPETPWLYEVQIQVIGENGEILDTKTSVFGMRSFEMDTESKKKGMLYLNGRRIRLRGANTMGFEQQDVMKGDMEQLVEDILLAKACNMNFLRITQRPVQDEIYAYCDMLGLMTQTDLPLFGVLRRNQFAEAARQAGEMEHLVRNHPCNIIVSYINEPFPNANNAPHRNLSRNELMDFFEVADKMVYLENPDRVIKHVDGDYDPPSMTLPDNHCYTGWYNGHGLDAGAMYKGDWIPVKPDWYYGCGEYGAEGLDSISVMRKHYPKEWLPESDTEETDWSPNCIVGSQTGNFHYFFYETPHTLVDWIEKSQEYQAESVKWMTEAFRRNADVVSIALHLFIDAFPAGWMKSIVDVDRNLKLAYYVYRDALTPTMVSLRTDRLTYFTGETAEIEVWLCNDCDYEFIDSTIVYKVERPDGSVIGGSETCNIEACDVTYVGEINVSLGEMPGTLYVKCAILDKDRNVLHSNSIEIKAYAIKHEQKQMYLYTPNMGGIAAKVIKDYQGESVDLEHARCVLIDDYSDYVQNKNQIDKWVSEGNKLVFVDLSEGDYEVCGKAFSISQSSMMPMHFVSRDTNHKWVEGFGEKDFRNWYEVENDRIAPILESTVTMDEMTPVLLSGNTDKKGNWGKVMAVGEMDYGRGKVVVCQLKLAGRVKENPVAWIFGERMLDTK